MDYIAAKLKAIDPKVIATGVGYLLTLLVLKLSVDLNTVLIPGYLTVNGAIALAGALVAGYWKANLGTILRTKHEDGNPDPELVKSESGQASVGLIAFVLIVILLVIFLKAATGSWLVLFLLLLLLLAFAF